MFQQFFHDEKWYSILMELSVSLYARSILADNNIDGIGMTKFMTLLLRPASPENRRSDSCLVSVDWYNMLHRVLLPTPILPSTRTTLTEEGFHSCSARPLSTCLPGRSHPWLFAFSFIPLHRPRARSYTVKDLGSKLDGKLSSSFFGQHTLGSWAVLTHGIVRVHDRLCFVNPPLSVRTFLR
jgi:hypothetical protein